MQRSTPMLAADCRALRSGCVRCLTNRNTLSRPVVASCLTTVQQTRTEEGQASAPPFPARAIRPSADPRSCDVAGRWCCCAVLFETI